MSKYDDLKHKCYTCNMELPNRNLVLYTFGNVSAIDREKNVFAIKPSGVDYEKLKPEDIVICDLNNNVIEGDLRPSSDTKTHSILYRNFSDIGGIVHTHSTYACAWAQAIRSIPIFGANASGKLKLQSKGQI